MLKPVVDTISGFFLETPDDRCAMRPETNEKTASELGE
jgi:hypothetical protein